VGGKDRADFWKTQCSRKSVCEWEPGHGNRGTCKPAKCEALRTQGLKLQKQFDESTDSMDSEFSKDKPPTSKKSSMGSKEIRSNIGRAKVFQDVTQLQQNAKDAECEWFKHPKEGDPDFSAIEEKMGQKEKSKEVQEVMKKDKNNRQGILDIMLAGVGSAASKIQKPKGDKYKDVEGKEELKDETQVETMENKITERNDKQPAPSKTAAAPAPAPAKKKKMGPLWEFVRFGLDGGALQYGAGFP